MTNPWTAELVGKLKELSAQGLSTKRIASELPGNFSRNAIIGKLHRLGLYVGRDQGGRPKRLLPTVPKKLQGTAPRTGTPHRPARLPQDTAPPTVPLEPEAPTRPAGPVCIHDLHERTCRWPLGHWQAQPPYDYCGKRTSPGRPYCPGHDRASLKANEGIVAGRGYGAGPGSD